MSGQLSQSSPGPSWSFSSALPTAGVCSSQLSFFRTDRTSGQTFRLIWQSRHSRGCSSPTYFTLCCLGLVFLGLTLLPLLCCMSVPVSSLFPAEGVWLFSQCMRTHVPSIVCFLHQSCRSTYRCLYSFHRPMVKSLSSFSRGTPGHGALTSYAGATSPYPSAILLRSPPHWGLPPWQSGGFPASWLRWFPPASSVQ